MVNGKQIYNSEGKSLTVGEFERLANAIFNFLNKDEYKHTLDTIKDKLGKRLSNNDTSFNEKRKSRSHPFIKTALEKYKSFSSNIPDEIIFRLHFADTLLSQHILDISDEPDIDKKMKDKIKEIFLLAIIKNKGSRKIQQTLFDECGHLNKDWERIVQFELNTIGNNAYLMEERMSLLKDEKLYFSWHDIIYEYSCNFCRKYNNKLVLFVDEPLSSDKIDDKYTDTAIWIGKNNIGEENEKRWWLSAGIQHPGCRGYWLRENPELEERLGYDFKSIHAKRDKKDRVWGEALDEVLDTGAKQDEPDFLNKVKKVYNKKMKENKG